MSIKDRLVKSKLTNLIEEFYAYSPRSAFLEQDVDEELTIHDIISILNLVIFKDLIKKEKET